MDSFGFVIVVVLQIVSFCAGVYLAKQNEKEKAELRKAERGAKLWKKIKDGQSSALDAETQ